MIIEDYNINAVHTFQVRTLKELNFKTRVTLSNNSNTNSKYTTAYKINLRVYKNKEQTFSLYENICTIEPQDKIIIDCQEFDKDINSDSIFIFIFIPNSHIGQIYDHDKIKINREELWYLMTAQDHYVEYYNDFGFSSGVLYQCGAFNYKKFSKESTTIIQAPKCYVSENINTYISLVNTSLSDAYQEKAILKCALNNEKYEQIISWTEEIAPYEAKLLNIREILLKSNLSLKELDFSCFYAVSNNVTLLPLVINHNRSTNTLAVEHSLPPNYYGSNIIGIQRAQVIKSLYNSNIFT